MRRANRGQTMRLGQNDLAARSTTAALARWTERASRLLGGDGDRVCQAGHAIERPVRWSLRQTVATSRSLEDSLLELTRGSAEFAAA